ncbi:MAG: hypothetical protein ACRYGR_09495 [Janthinobacterium lividum]
MKNMIKFCSLALAVSLGFIPSSEAKFPSLSYDINSSVTLVKSEWRRGQDDIALGDRLMRKGEFDMASGRPKLGRREIEQGRDMKERGREQVREFRSDKEFRADREWLWKGHPFRQW